jgi:hypothetical protein
MNLKEVGCDDVVWIPLVGPVAGSFEPSGSMKCGETRLDLRLSASQERL